MLVISITKETKGDVVEFLKSFPFYHFYHCGATRFVIESPFNIFYYFVI